MQWLLSLLLSLFIVNTAYALDCNEAKRRLEKSPAGQVVWRAIEAQGGCRTWTKKKDVQYRVSSIYHKLDADYEQENIVKMLLGDTPTVLIKKIAPLKGVLLGLNGNRAWRTNEKVSVKNKTQLAEAKIELQEAWDQSHLPLSLAAKGISLEAMDPILTNKGAILFHRVRIRKSKTEWKIFYFDAKNGWLERIHFQTETGPLTGRAFLQAFERYKKIDKVTIPLKRDYFIPGPKGQIRGPAFLTQKLSELRFDNGLNPKQFENPQMIRVKLKTQE